VWPLSARVKTTAADLLGPRVAAVGQTSAANQDSQLAEVSVTDVQLRGPQSARVAQTGASSRRARRQMESRPSAGERPQSVARITWCQRVVVYKTAANSVDFFATEFASLSAAKDFCKVAAVSSRAVDRCA